MRERHPKVKKFTATTHRRDTPFTPGDDDHLYVGQVWEGNGGQCTVLTVFDGSSLKSNRGLATIQVGTSTREVVGEDPNSGKSATVDEPAEILSSGHRYFAGRRLVDCVTVRRVPLMVEGKFRLVVEVDRSRRWVVKNGFGQFVRREK